MKIITFADIHGDLSALEHIRKEIKEKKIDLAICAGDYTFFENHVEFLTKKLSEIGIDILLIHGNHEDSDAVRVLCKKYKNIYFLHEKAKKIGDFVFIGYGGGGFSHKDPNFVKTMKELMKNVDKKDKIVLITHAPPGKTKLDNLPGYGHVGNMDYRKFIEDNNVILAISGHLHENFGKEDKVGKAKVINPGYKGKVIEL